MLEAKFVYGPDNNQLHFEINKSSNETAQIIFTFSAPSCFINSDSFLRLLYQRL